MNSPVVIAVAIACLMVAWLAWSFSWTAKQTLLGAWVVALPNGTQVTLQFDGERKGGTYKQLSKQNGVESREFGHWTIKLLEVRLLIMATDIKDHPRFGLDTRYWLNFTNKDQITIGRAESCDIGLFGDNQIEKLHASILLSGSRYYVEDEKTPAGTFVNDQPAVGRVALRSGDLIRVGGSVLCFRERAKRA